MLSRVVSQVSDEIFIEVDDADCASVIDKLQSVANKLMNWDYLDEYDLNFQDDDNREEEIMDYELMDLEVDKLTLEDEIIFRLGPFAELNELFDKMDNKITYQQLGHDTEVFPVEEHIINNLLDKLTPFEREHAVKRMEQLVERMK